MVGQWCIQSSPIRFAYNRLIKPKYSLTFLNQIPTICEEDFNVTKCLSSWNYDVEQMVSLRELIITKNVPTLKC